MTKLRVLDLGCHDGFVTNFVARQLGGNLHVDGIEANPEGVRVAAERAKRDGLEGEYKVGLAEDALTLFTPGSYDAVVCFEIIEHVPDVPGFLDVIEAMVKPGGRIYISTPDGTFGAGQNPHHLRVYRAVDLFDLLRSRGEVADMAVGVDTITVGAYVPRETVGLDLAIYCGPGWETWSPMDIETKGLGGSETAAVRLAEALSELGHTVTVYGQVEQCAFKQVGFRHYSTFDPTRFRDGVILSRVPHLLTSSINTPRKVLWMHDTDYGPALTQEAADAADAIFVLSDWHRGHVLETYPFTEGKLRVTSNAIVPAYFEGDAPTRNPQRAIYSSSPDRGLDFLLEIWPEVRKIHADAELTYCYASVYDQVAEQVPEIAAFRDRIQKLADQPGVINLGAMPQQELARYMRSCGVWLSPGWSTPSDVRFHETYCIGAVEAAAAGCARVMSAWGALAERDEDTDASVWIGDPEDGSKPDPVLWTMAICDALEREVHLPSPAALETEWELVAQDFLAELSPVTV